MDARVVCEEPLLRGVEEVRAVIYAGLVAGGAAKDLGAPCVSVVYVVLAMHKASL